MPCFLQSKTNPISAVGGRSRAPDAQPTKRGLYAERSQFGAARPAPGGRLCKTNPISGRPRADPGVGCTNKANRLRVPSDGRGAARSPLLAPGPSVRNEANLSIADWGQTCGGTPALQLATSGLRGPIVQNEPNFGEVGRWNTQHSTILSFHHSSPMPVVRNKANFPAAPDGTRSAGRGGRGCPIVKRLRLRSSLRGTSGIRRGEPRHRPTPHGPVIPRPPPGLRPFSACRPAGRQL
jgi:hypothetical protein